MSRASEDFEQNSVTSLWSQWNWLWFVGLISKQIYRELYLYLLARAAVRHGNPGPDFTSSALIGFIFLDTPTFSADRVLLRAAPAEICIKII